MAEECVFLYQGGITMIQIQNVSKTFESKSGNIHALRDVSLQIDKGDLYGIIGQSGAGKSTLVRCINLLESFDKGKIIVDGDSMASLSDKELRVKRKDIGMIFQSFNLFSSRNVYDNVAYSLNKKEKETKHEKIMDLLSLVGLEDRTKAYPKQLSGGQKQRVAIARALINDPQILLCDEATSALDPQTTRSILKLLEKINKELDVTIVIITHEMNVIKEICQKVALMEDGFIIDSGRVEDVFFNAPELLGQDNFKLEDLNTSTDETVLKLSFQNEKTQTPIISRISKNFDVEANIMHGTVETIGKAQFGTLILGLSGTQQKEAIEYLKNLVDVEVLNND